MTEIEGRSLSRAKKECGNCDNWIIFSIVVVLIAITASYTYVQHYTETQNRIVREAISSSEGSWAVFCVEVKQSEATNTQELQALSMECDPQ